MNNFILRFIRDDRGQDLIEYVMIAAVVSVGSVLGAGALGRSVNGWYDEGRKWAMMMVANTFH